MAGARRARGLEVEVGGAVVALAACEVPATIAAETPRASDVPARCSPSARCIANAILGVELDVGDVARERVAEVDELALAVAEAARAKAHDGFVVLLGRRA